MSAAAEESRSRRMEGGSALGTVEARRARREEALRKLLRRPERLLAIGWGEPAELDEVAQRVTAAAWVHELPAEGDQAPGAPWPAAVWEAGERAPEAAALARVRGLLAERGRLLLRLAPGAGEDRADSHRVAVRSLVRALSEAGFVILQEPPPEVVGGPSVLARRDEFTVRSIAAGDDEAVRALFAECFPHDRRDSAHWRWKYRDNPWSGRTASLALSPEGELAVHYAGYAVPFWRRGRELLGLQIGDTMTGEGFRSVGRGTSSLLARAVRHFFAVHRGGRFALYYGFNTGPIQRFCRWFIGGTRVEAVDFRRAPVVPGRWAGGRYRVKRVERAERVGRSWDRLFRRAAPAYGFLVRRRARWVRWRYLERPDVDYLVLAARRFRRLVAWAVFRREGDVLLWGDALVHPRHPRAAEALLAAALERPEAAGVSAVEAWFPERPEWWHAELGRLGFERRPHPQELGLMVLPDDEEAPPPLHELYYAMGDGDLF